MLRIASLGSGSTGNALLVQSRHTTLLLDCGFSLKATVARLAALGVSPLQIDAILVTHEHGDHVKGVGPLSRKFGLPVWATHGTFHGCRDNRFASVELFHAHEHFDVGDIALDPFPTPHDAAESCQFVFSSDGVRFAAATDLGACTPHVLDKLQVLHGLLVECNYDNDMLRSGPYPPSLQARIRSNYGHLGNEQAAELVASIDHAQLQCILLGHLSEQNNSDECARRTMLERLNGNPGRINVLQPQACSVWHELVQQPEMCPVAAVAEVC